MKALLVILSMVFLAGCTKEKICDAGKTAAGVVSAQVAVQLDCKNASAIQADVEKLLVAAKVCEVKPSGTIGNVICQPVVDGLVNTLLKTIPSAWECSGGKITEEGKAKLLEVCQKAI